MVANDVVVKNEPDSYFYYTNKQYKEPNVIGQKQGQLGSAKETKTS